MMLYSVIELIKSGEKEDAVKIILGSVGEEVVKQLKIRFRFQRNDSLSILNDAILKVLIPKIEAGEVTHLTKKYVKQTCLNLALNQKKKNDSYKEIKKKYGDYAKSFLPGFSYDAKVLKTPIGERVSRALASLKEKCRKIIDLKFVKDFGHEDIFKTIGLKNEATSRNTLKRCMEKLKEALKGN